MIYAWQSPFLTVCTMLCLQGVPDPLFQRYTAFMLLAFSIQRQGEALITEQETCTAVSGCASPVQQPGGSETTDAAANDTNMLDLSHSLRGLRRWPQLAPRQLRHSL